MLALGWYCPCEGDGRRLGTDRPERPPTFAYLSRVARAAERAGAELLLVPTGGTNDSFAPDAPYAETWTTAAGLAAVTRRITLLVAVNPAGMASSFVAHQVDTLHEASGGRIAINLVAGGGPTDAYGNPPLDHDARYARLADVACAIRTRTPDVPLFLGGASEAAKQIVERHVGTYLMWGEPPEAVAERVADIRSRVTRPLRIGLRVHVIARAHERTARRAAALLLSQATVARFRAREYAALDSVGQARMNAIAADPDDWVAPGLWAGIRRVRGGAGTALVGSYGQVARLLDRYREAGIDLVIASGYPHLEEVGRVARHVWPLLRS